MIYSTAIIIGLIALLGSFFILSSQAKVLVQLAAFLAIVWSTYYSGVNIERAVWQDKMNTARLEIAVLEQRAQEINAVVITEFIPKIGYIDRIEKQVVTEFVTVESDSKCQIQNGFVRLHDSVVDQILIKPQPTDDESQKIKLSQLGETVKFNYSACQRNAEQLKQLQQWIKTQEKNWNSDE